MNRVMSIRSAVVVALCSVVTPSLAVAQPRIVIDAGHGGSDPGAAGNGLQEKTVTLDVAARFRALLDADTADTAGGGRWVALMTRSNDTFVSLAARAAFSNSQDADLFMSIHNNSFSSATANGTETYSFAEGTTGAALRNLVQAEVIAAWATTNRGNKTANFAVLRETAAPAVLHELAFITNASDAAKLGSATMRQRAAVAHLRALQRHMGIAPYVPAALQGLDERTDATDDSTAPPVAPGDDLPAATEATAGGCTAPGIPGAASSVLLLGLLRRRRRRR